MIIAPIFRLVARIATFVIYIITIASAFGGYVNPHHLTFPAILNLAFPWLAIISIIITIAWFIAGKWITGAVGVLTIIACWAPLSMAVPLQFSKHADPGQKTFSLLSYNILHMEDQENPDNPGERALKFLLETDADIVSLQEFLVADLDHPKIKIVENNPDLWKAICQKYPFRDISESHDLSVFSKYPVERLNLYSPDQINPQCYAFFRFKIGNHVLTLANVHLISFALTDKERDVITQIHNSKTAKLSLSEFRNDIKGKMGLAYVVREEAAKEVLNCVNDINTPLIVAGDFNDVPSSWTYRLFLKDGFKDAYAETNFGPTWTYNAHMMFFHLDQIMYKGELKALSVKRFSIDSSDHYPQLATFAFTD